MDDYEDTECPICRRRLVREARGGGRGRPLEDILADKRRGECCSFAVAGVACDCGENLGVDSDREDFHADGGAVSKWQPAGQGRQTEGTMKAHYEIEKLPSGASITICIDGKPAEAQRLTFVSPVDAFAYTQSSYATRGETVSITRVAMGRWRTQDIEIHP